MSNLVGKTLLDRYHVQEFLGRGGMAEVYKVWDSHRKSHLAMKILLENLAIDKVFMRRFAREANTLSKLQHKNIVRFYGLEQQGKLAFMLMDYVEGGSLKLAIFEAGGPLPLSQVREIMGAVCFALSYAHHNNFVHCDIKAENIMLTKYGEALVMDFGIARMSDAATATMVGAGTPAYMAPEQVKGLEPIPQTDIYSLGIVLYEMLTGGERPFTGEQATITGNTSEKVRWEQTHIPPPSPKQWNLKLSPALEKIVLKCLEKDPQKRYHDTIELYNALELAIGEEETERLPERLDPVVVTPPPSPPPAVKTPPAPPPALPIFNPPPTRVKIPRRKDALPALKIAREKITAISGMIVGKVKAFGLPSWATYLLPAIAVLLAIFGFSAATRPSVSTTYFNSDRSGKTEVYLLHNGVPMQATSSPDNSTSWGAAPASTGVYFTSDRSGKMEIYYFDQIGKVIQITHTPQEPISKSVVVSPAGLPFFESDRSGNYEIYYADKNGKIIQFTHSQGKTTNSDIAFSPAGLLYFTSDRSGKDEIYYISADGKPSQVTHTDGNATSSGAAFSPDGLLYFISDRSGKNEIYYLSDTHKAIQVTHSPGNSISLDPAFDQNGTLYFTSDRSGKNELYFFRQDLGTNQITHTAGSAESWSAVSSVN